MNEREQPPIDETLRILAGEFLAGETSPEEFRRAMRKVELTRASHEQYFVDLDRSERCGFPEAVYGEGKSEDVLAGVLETLLEAGQDAFATRVESTMAAKLKRRFPTAHYHEIARTFRVDADCWSGASELASDEVHASSSSSTDPLGNVLIVTAGSTDMPVAEEARETLKWMRVSVDLMSDVGVAGPHRLVQRAGELRGRDAIVTVAGMEGALPSIVGGYADCPVIAVPTSVGFGASLGGIAALLSMLNSCAANVTCVNIDAGFKAGYVAGMIARRQASVESRHAPPPSRAVDARATDQRI